MKRYEILMPIIPMGAVRTTRKGKYTPTAVTYHNWMDKFRFLWKRICMEQGLPYDTVLPGEIISMHFGLPIHDPNVGTPKVRAKKLSRIGQPYTKKPDFDNLIKAVVDSIFYKKEQNDCSVHKIREGVSKIYTPFNTGFVKITFAIGKDYEYKTLKDFILDGIEVGTLLIKEETESIYKYDGNGFECVTADNVRELGQYAPFSTKTLYKIINGFNDGSIEPELKSTPYKPKHFRT